MQPEGWGISLIAWLLLKMFTLMSSMAVVSQWVNRLRAKLLTLDKCCAISWSILLCDCREKQISELFLIPLLKSTAELWISSNFFLIRKSLAWELFQPRQKLPWNLHEKRKTRTRKREKFNRPGNYFISFRSLRTLRVYHLVLVRSQRSAFSIVSITGWTRGATLTSLEDKLIGVIDALEKVPNTAPAAWQTLVTLKTPDVPSICFVLHRIFRFQPISLPPPWPPRQHWNVCMRNLLRNFMTRKEKRSQQRGRKKGNGTFDIYSFAVYFYYFIFS